MSLRTYLTVFTDGKSDRRLCIAEPDIEFAAMRARSVADAIMEQRVFGEHDWSRWKFIVMSADEGNREVPFLA
jgi:hypothetical protein